MLGNHFQNHTKITKNYSLYIRIGADIMTVREENELKKEYLNKYKKMGYKIRSLEEQGEALKEKIEGIKALTNSDMPRGSGEINDLSLYMVRMEEMEERIKRAKKERLEIMTDIENTIADIDDGIESKILHDKYIKGKNWDDIAEDISYTRRHTIRIHGAALYHMKLKSQEKNEKK